MSGPSRRVTSSFRAKEASTRPVADARTARTMKRADTPAPAGEIATRQLLAGRYLLESELGQGGVGRVFKAYDSATRTQVALKVVRPEIAGRRRWLQRLGREVRHAREVQHPNVCRIFELVEADGYTFLTMELAARGVLRAELATTALRPLAERFADARGLSAGVAAIHAAGIVHRDLKPANVLRMGDGRIVVSDFGLAVLGSHESGLPEGTWGYMAPEVIQTGAATTRSDVWALGVVIYEILFGARPMLETRMRRPRGADVGLEAALATLCLACCAVDPLERPTDAREVLARLDALDGETLQSILQRRTLEPREAVGIVASSLDALAPIQRRKKLHGAICPANVFVGANGFVRLLDPARDGALAQREADAPYLSPEQARGESGIDGRADIFALGRVLHECLAGPQDEAEHAVETLARRALGETPDLGTLSNALPPRLTKLLERMLSRDPARRPRDAGVLAAELRNAAERIDDGAVARPPIALSGEQRVLYAVAIDLSEEVTTLGEGETAQLRGVVESIDARLLLLDERRAVIAIVARGTPNDLADLAGHCALALNERWGHAKIAVAIGHAMLSRRGPRGEAVDRAVALLGDSEPGKVRVDERAARGLSARFRVVPGRRPFLAGRARAGERPRTVLGTETPCFGRERELSTLLALWTECVDEPVARAALLTAPAGAGKTRLRHEFSDRLEQRGDRFLSIVGRGDALSTGAPFTLLGPALAAAAGVALGTPIRAQAEALQRFVSQQTSGSAQRIAPFLGEIAGIHFPDDALPALQAARQNPRLMADQMTAAWLEFVDGASRTQPMLLVLEDLQWGDAPSLQLVDAALRVSRERPLLVLGLARPDMDRRFPDLWAERSLQRIALPPLTAKSAHRLVRHVLPDASGDEVGWIVERADGNPLYIEELVRAVGSASRSAGGARLPETIAGTVHARFDALGGPAKRVLRAASIFGEVFSSDGVRAVLASHDVDVDACLGALADREIVYRRAEDTGHEFAFRHALLQQAAYDMLAPPDRVVGHRRAARYLEGSGEGQAVPLVQHFEQAGDPRKAAHWCRVAAEQALEGNDLRTAVERVTRATALGPSRADLVRLGVLEARARRWLGDLPAAERAAKRAVASASGEIWFEAMAELTWILGAQNKLDTIAALARSVAQRAPRRGEKRAWLDALTSAARWMVPAGQLEAATKLLERISKEADDFEGALAVRVFLLRGELARLRGDLATFVENGEAAQAICESTGDVRTLSEVLLEVGCGKQELGLLEDALELFRRSAEAKSRPGLEATLAYVEANMAYTLCLLERFDEARATIDRALGGAGPIGTRGRSMCELYSSYIALGAGDLARAKRAAKAAMDSSRNWSSAHVQAAAIMARVLHLQGRHRQALALARRAVRILDAGGQIEDGEALVRVVLVECLLGAGDSKSARAELARAKKRVDDRALLIRDPKLRRTFRTRLPEHALIDRLAREHLTDGDAVRAGVSSSSPSPRGPARARYAATRGRSNRRPSRSRT
jgi:eukaryotic-like serine/threonine-protein kinase